MLAESLPLPCGPRRSSSERLREELQGLAGGVYDLARYRRLHPAYVAALAYILVLQGVALYMLTSPNWAGVVLRIYGY